MIRVVFSLLSAWVGFSAWVCQVEAKTYIVQQGDTLSNITQNLVPGRIYGRKGNLAKLLSLNPQLEDPDDIRPGTAIQLPKGAWDLVSGQKNNTADQAKPDRYSKGVDDQDRRLAQLNDLGMNPLDGGFKAYSSVGFSAGFGFLRLDSSQSGSASAVSDLGYGASLDWRQHWSASFHTGVYLNYQGYSMSTAEGASLPQRSAEVSEMGLQLGQSISKGLWVDAKVGYRSSPYLRSETQDVLAVEDVPTVVFGLCPRINVLSRGDLRLGLLVPLEYELSGQGPNISTNGGVSYGVGAEVVHQLRWGELIGQGVYQTISNGFNQADAERQEVLSKIGFRYYFGGQ